MKLNGTGWHAAPNSLYDGFLAPFESTVLGYLYRRAGPDGSSWPSVNRIAKDCKMSQTAVRITLKGLEALGRVTIERRQSADGDADTNVYRLVEGVPRETEGGTSPHAGGVPRQVMSKSVKSEVPSSEVQPPQPPQRGGARDIGLAALKDGPNPGWEAARRIVTLFVAKNRMPRTKTILDREFPRALELLEAGIPEDFLAETIESVKERIRSIAYLHYHIDMGMLQFRIGDDALAALKEKIWGNKTRIG